MRAGNCPSYYEDLCQVYARETRPLVLVTTPCPGTRWRRTRCTHPGCSSRTLPHGAQSTSGSTGPDARSRRQGFARTRRRASRTCGLLRSVHAVAHDLRPDQAGAGRVGVVVLELEDPAYELWVGPLGRPDVHLVAGPLPVLVEGCGHSDSSSGCRWSAMSSTRPGFLVRPWPTSSRRTAATALLVVSHGWKCAGTGATAVQAAAQVAFISSSANFSAVVSLSFIPRPLVRESAAALRCRSRRRRTPRRAGRGRGSFLPALLAAPTTGTGVVETLGVRHLRS